MRLTRKHLQETIFEIKSVRKTLSNQHKDQFNVLITSIDTGEVGFRYNCGFMFYENLIDCADHTFSLFVPAEKLITVVENLEKEEFVDMIVNETEIVFKDSTMEYTINCVEEESEDFILDEKVNTIRFNKSIFSEILKKAVISSDKKHTDSVQRSMLIADMDDSVDFVTTDIHRITVINTKEVEFTEKRRIADHKSVLIPIETCEIVSKIFDEVNEIYIHEHQWIRVCDEKKTFISKSYPNHYPNYRSVIGDALENFDAFYTVNTKDVSKVTKKFIKMCKLNKEETIYPMSMELMWDKMIMMVDSPDFTNMKTTVDVQRTYQKPDGAESAEMETIRKVYCNVKYIDDFTKIFSGDVAIQIAEDNQLKPVSLYNETDSYKHLYMTMPLRNKHNTTSEKEKNENWKNEYIKKEELF